MKSILCSLDWIPTSGSLKLLEINTNVVLGGFFKVEDYLDFSALTTWCNSKNIQEVKIHHSDNAYYIYDYLSNPIPMVSDEVQSKLSASLATQNISCSLYIDSQGYPDALTEIDNSTILDLRITTSGNSKLDYMCLDKNNLRGYLGSIGSSSLMPETGSSQLQDNNADGIPDFLWKISTRDSSTGLGFYEYTTNYSSSISNTTGIYGDTLEQDPRQSDAQPFIERYYTPDNDKWGWFNDIHYTVAFMEDGTTIPLVTNQDNPFHLTSFQRMNPLDYSDKNLRSKNKIIYHGLFGENTKIKMLDGSDKTPLQIQSQIVDLNFDKVKTVKIDQLNLGDWSKNTPNERFSIYTSYTGSFNFETGSNNFVFVPKYSEDCVTIDSTVFNGNTLLPIKSGSSWQIKKASDIVAGDVYVSSSMEEGTVGSVGTTSNQVLIQPSVVGQDVNYQRSMFCDDKLISYTHQLYTIGEPLFNETPETVTILPDLPHYSASVSGSDCFNQEMSLLSYNIKSGSLYDWSNYSGLVASYSTNILNNISASYTGSVWTW